MNPSVGPKQGAVKPPTKQDCEELEKKNTKARADVIKKLEKKKKKTKADKAALKKAKRKGMAISSANSTVPGAAGTSTASSSGVANSQIAQNADGGSSAQRQGMNKKQRKSKDKKLDKKKKEAGILCGQSHVHPGGGKGAHAEAKIFNTMSSKKGTSMTGGSVLLNIDWRSSTFEQGEVSGMPCQDCYAMLCKAARECDIKIFICDHKNEPQEMTKDCDKPGAYDDLCERIDDNPTPGRS